VSVPRPLLSPYPVRPFAELGIGDTRIPTGQARWNVARWDAPDARWASTEPTWLDVSCEVNGAQSDTGRERSTDRFRPGTADVTLRNDSGWADLRPPPFPPAALALRPGRQVRYGVDTPRGRRVLWRGYIDEAIPLYQPYGTDVVELTCLDAFGELARVRLVPLAAPVGAGDNAAQRVNRILDAAAWPALYRDVQPSSLQVQGTDLGGSVADLLGVTADSSGGAVFGDLAGRIAYRPRDWQTYLPTTPPAAIVGNIDPAAVCPSTWELSWRRRDVAAVVTMGRDDGVGTTVADTAAQQAIGSEPFVRADLITANPGDLDTLARRVLVTRGIATMPRVEAVTLDAARDPGDGSTVELMATARPETPTRLRCQLATNGRTVFDVDMFVTAVAHTIDDRGRWLCRLTLDAAGPYAAPGGRWDGARWDRATWTNVVVLLDEARTLIGAAP
jgi:hypothetical protein